MDELVKRLRNEAENPDNFPEDSAIMREAAQAIDQLVQIHQLDLSELVRLRRKIQALLEEREASHA